MFVECRLHINPQFMGHTVLFKTSFTAKYGYSEAKI